VASSRTHQHRKTPNSGLREDGRSLRKRRRTLPRKGSKLASGTKKAAYRRRKRVGLYADRPPLSGRERSLLNPRGEYAKKGRRGLVALLSEEKVLLQHMKTAVNWVGGGGKECRG